MMRHTLQDFLENLILGEHQLMKTTSTYKRAILTGYLCFMIFGICIFYIVFDTYAGFSNGYLYYLSLMVFTAITFYLNRISYYGFAKFLLLFSTLIAIVSFSSTEVYDSGNYFNLFPLSVAAFALFDFKSVYKGVLFTAFSIVLFFAVYIYAMPIRVPGPVPDSTLIDLMVHFLISLTATVLIIVFLIRLNKKIESNLILKEVNLKRITHELKQSQQRFELAISGSNAGIYDWDIQKDVIYHSPISKKLLGYNPDELNEFTSKTFYSLIHPDDIEQVRHTLEGHLKNGTRYAVEMRMKTKKGKYQWFSDSGQAVWNESNDPVRLVGSIIKINQRKVAEEHIKKQNAMLEKSNLELDNFVYSVSHDIRSPLTSILGLINIASKTHDQQEVYECLNMMKSQIHRLDTFTEDIQDFSKNLRLNEKSKEVNLLQLIQKIIRQTDFGKNVERLEIETLISDSFTVVSDPLRLEVILKNLISNSIQFSNLQQENPWIRISALKVNSNFQLIIDDNGEGIRKELQKNIFDMFYRGSENSKGSGLGLYIVKEIVDKLHGSIKVNSSYGNGCQFIIELPDHRISKKKSPKKMGKASIA